MPLLPEQVEPRLRGGFGHPYVWQEECPSTQELARGLPHGGVAATDHQTAGRGRRGRSWVAPPGTALLFSLSLTPRTPPDRLAAFSLVAAEAVATACHPTALVRWPNDVIVDGAKLAGVLPEVKDGTLVLGVGINVNMSAEQLPADARVPPTSLRLITGMHVDRAGLLADVLAELEGRYDAFERDGFPGLERDELRGRRVSLSGGPSGTAEGVDREGRLLIDGRALTSAEVERVEQVDEAQRQA
jgi:BirA family biotin operon repressor/biotin-[acetyl-CoA-carboxylase] ligase